VRGALANRLSAMKFSKSCQRDPIPETSVTTPAGHSHPVASRVPYFVRGPREQYTSDEVREKDHSGKLRGSGGFKLGFPFLFRAGLPNIQLTASESMLRPSFRCKCMVNTLFVHELLRATAFSWPSVGRRRTMRSEAKKRKRRTSQPAVSGIAAQLSA
jgi:hypothetical protein